MVQSVIPAAGYLWISLGHFLNNVHSNVFTCSALSSYNFVKLFTMLRLIIPLTLLAIWIPCCSFYDILFYDKDCAWERRCPSGSPLIYHLNFGTTLTLLRLCCLQCGGGVTITLGWCYRLLWWCFPPSMLMAMKNIAHIPWSVCNRRKSFRSKRCMVFMV